LFVMSGAYDRLWLPRGIATQSARALRSPAPPRWPPFSRGRGALRMLDGAVAPSFLSRPAVARIAPFAVFIAFIAAQSLLALDEATQRWVTVARGVAVAALLGFFWRDYVELRNPRSSPLDYVLAVLAGFAVFAIWITFDSGWAVMGEPGRGFAPLDSAGQLDWLLVALRFLGLAAVVPVMEELFWRSFLMRWIDARDFLARDPRRATRVAFVLSCALFSLEHSAWFAGLLAGAAYAWLYTRTSSLWIPITSHAITNGTLGLWILATGNWRFW
jgi:CAAX prenyl protease-like protein